MIKIYLIIRTDFDGMENNISAALISESLGYIEAVDDSEATRFIDKLSANTQTKYKGWDKETYPKFSFQQLKKL